MNILDQLLEEFDENSLAEEENFEEDSEELQSLAEYEERRTRQIEYEQTLIGRDYTSPCWLFRHSFMTPGYLDCKMIKVDQEEYSLQDVADRMIQEAYIDTSRGSKLGQKTFCSIWNEMLGYIYSGYILTPNGKIEVETFKSQIMKVLFLMGTEEFNLDTLSDHLFRMYISAYSTDAYNNDRLIPFKNGDLVLNKDRKSFTFYEGRKSAVPYRFDYEFRNIDNTCAEPPFPNFQKWRDDLFDEDDVYSLKQILGYLLLPVNEAQRAFFVIGKAKTGKSILTDCIIPKMLGEASFPISIGQFVNDKFQAATSEGKLCMVDDDIGNATLSDEDSGRFKNFVSAKTVKIEHKYCNPVKINNSARIVCSGNHMIKSDDKTDGFTRRLHPIYVKPRTIDEEDIDVDLPDKIQDEIEMIVLWALEGLLEIASNKFIPYVSDRTKNNLLYYEEAQKWEELFINECFEYKVDTVTYSNDLQEVLSNWLKDNAEVAGEGTLSKKFGDVTRWLKDEGSDKYGFVYKRGIKRGDKYNARGYINMSPRKPIVDPIVYEDERGHIMIHVTKRNRQKSETEE